MSAPNSAITCGSATAIMVELSGASMVASATVSTAARSADELTAANDSSRADADETGVTIHLQELAVANCRRRSSRADHGGDAVLPRYHRAVAQHASRIGDDRRGGRKQRCPWRRGGLGAQDVPLLQLPCLGE